MKLLLLMSVHQRVGNDKERDANQGGDHSDYG